MEAGEIALGIAITNSVISGLTFAYFYVQHKKRRDEVAALRYQDDILLELVSNVIKKVKEVAGADKTCNVPRDSAHKEASNAVGVFQSTLGLAAEIKAKRTAQELKKDITCPACEGTQEFMGFECQSCEGTGEVIDP